MEQYHELISAVGGLLLGPVMLMGSYIWYRCSFYRIRLAVLLQYSQIFRGIRSITFLL